MMKSQMCRILLSSSFLRVFRILSHNCLYITWSFIWACGRAFGYVGGHFGAQARVWAHRWVFWCLGMNLGTRSVYWCGCVFSHMGGHFGAQVRIWAYGRASLYRMFHLEFAEYQYQKVK